MAGNWSSTVTIETGKAADAYARIQSTHDAANYLLNDWAKERSPIYCAAIRTCAKAIRGEISHEAAYITFMAAVREANVALVANRRGSAADTLEWDIETALAEDILTELKALRMPVN